MNDVVQRYAAYISILLVALLGYVAKEYRGDFKLHEREVKEEFVKVKSDVYRDLLDIKREVNELKKVQDRDIWVGTYVKTLQDQAEVREGRIKGIESVIKYLDEKVKDMSVLVKERTDNISNRIYAIAARQDRCKCPIEGIDKFNLYDLDTWPKSFIEAPDYEIGLGQ